MNPDLYFGGKMTFLYLFLALCFVCIFGYFMYDYNHEYEWLHFLSKFKFFQNKNTFIIYLFKFWITALTALKKKFIKKAPENYLIFSVKQKLI